MRTEVSFVNGRLSIGTELRKGSAELQEAVVRALAAHCGFDVEIEPLQKGVDPEQCGHDCDHSHHEALRKADPVLDPRFPELRVLVAQAKRDWDRYGDQLLAELTKLLQEGRLLPLSRANEELLQDIFRDHMVRIEARFAGRSRDWKRMRQMADQGLVDPDRGLTEISYRLGRGLQSLQEVRTGAPGAPTMEEVVRRAMQVDLTREDMMALEYVQRRGAIYMRAPAEAQVREAERVLTQAELAMVREGVSEAIRGHLTPAEAERALRDAITSERLQNDAERVIVTELTAANNFGAWHELKKQTRAIGEADPWVFKITNPGACRECLRIWGAPGDPVRYRLSVVEAHSFGGGNFGLPREDWKATIEGTHPRCTCSKLMYWNPNDAAAIANTVDEIVAAWEQES